LLIGNGRPHSDVLTARQGECGSDIGGKHEKSCDRCRATRRWRFAGDSAGAADWWLPAGGWWSGRQPRRTRHTVCLRDDNPNPVTSRDEAPQKHVHVGKEPQRLKAKYHQVAISKSRFSSPGFCPGLFFELECGIKNTRRALMARHSHLTLPPRRRGRIF
jgi:hypothetical protein